MKFKPAGIYPAVWTPVDRSGDWLKTELAEQVRFLSGAGVDGFMVLGSTGEFVQFELKQRQEILEQIVPWAEGKPVLANISHVQVRTAAALGRHARQAGAAAVAIMAPYFYPMAPGDLAEFFLKTAGESGLPCVLYNFPERTGNRISLATIERVAERMPVVAIKQSGQDFDYHKELIALGREKGFSVMTGADTRLAEALQLGSSGCISGLANAIPEWLVEAYAAFGKGRIEVAEAVTGRVQELVKKLGALPFPHNIAASMAARGRSVGEPKMPRSAETASDFGQKVDDLKLFYRQFKLIA